MLTYNTLNFKKKKYNKYLSEATIDLLDKTFAIPEQFKFDILKVTQEYIARPDLISLDSYGDEMYADIICKINGISNPFELNAGDVIILPEYDVIEDFNKQITQEEIEIDQNEQDENVTSMPQPKLKNQPRKANEAVVGDKRYKINPENGIVIY